MRSSKRKPKAKTPGFSSGKPDHESFPVFSLPVFKKQFPVPSGLHGADDDFFKDPEVLEKTWRAVGLPPHGLLMSGFGMGMKSDSANMA